MERAKAKGKGKVSKVKDTVTDTVMEVNMGKRDVNKKEKSETKCSKPETM